MNQPSPVGTCHPTMLAMRLVCSGLVLMTLPLWGCSVGGEPENGFPGSPGLVPADDDDDAMTDGEDEDTTDTDGEDPTEGDRPSMPMPTTTGESEDDSSTGDPGCIGDCVELCFDGQDEDGDGAVDCDDSDCATHLACTCVTAPDEGFGIHVLCDEPMTWTMARDACEGSDMHLVSIDGEGHNAWLVGRSQAIDSISWWMGLSDLQAEGAWAWVDGSPLSYQRWYPGEPNNGTNAPEHCAAFPEHDAYSWNDLECATLRPFICER